MSLSTNLISGLSSGFDWRSMIDQLMAIEHKKVDLVENQKTEYENKRSEWQSVNTKLLSLKTAAEGLQEPEDFYVYTSNMTTDDSDVNASNLLSVSTSSTASKGSYTITVSSLASAQKLSSKSFSSFSDALGASYAGDILINGVAVNIGETDSLADVRDRINNANAGTSPSEVTASIVTYGSNDYRLILTSDTTGQNGIGLLNGGATDILNEFGLIDTARTAKNHIAGGDKSDAFTISTMSVKTLLGLSTTQTSANGDIVINGNSIGAIDLSTDTLTTIKDKFVTAGVAASIITETVEGENRFRILVEGGSNTYTDKNNILETLGILKGGVSDVLGVAGDVSNTSAGAIITESTLIKDIDGYTGHATDDYIHLEGTDTDGNSVGPDTTFIITDLKTVDDLMTKIESLFGDVTASVTGDGKIMVTDNTTGTSPLAVKIAVKNNGGTDDDTLNFDTDDDLGTADPNNPIRDRELIEGNDASVVVDGVTVTSSDNVVDDVLPGVTMNLLKADAGTTITLNINRDVDAIMSQISTFVDAYNEVTSYIHQQQSYDEDEETTGGILFGDGTLASVKSDLTSTLIQSVWGVSSEYATMGLVGINLNNEGQLSIDTDKLHGYLETNFNDVKSLFSVNGTSNAGTLEYVSCSSDTEAGEYTVHITTAATQSTSTSNNGTVGENETLTITEGDKTAEIVITIDDTLADIKNAINSEMSNVYTETLVGDAQLYEWSGGTTALSSSTKWDQVYIDGSNSANLADNDVISFTGTTRSGGEVEGSYTISDASVDTVQGLLSSIETAYGNDVTADVDSSGQIVLTDKSSGNSSLSITFDYTQAHDLSFGSSVSTSNTGGQEGRYAMDITATDDGSGHLELTHDNYGDDYSFIISEDAVTSGNKLWTGDDQTVDNGVDVAGTINGEAAIGSGQVLTGDDGENNVDGLVVKYTGTAENLDIGEVKLTLGAAELFDRVLYNITDSYDGYLSFKQDSLQDNIDSYETKIEEMEARIDRKMEMMINRFVVMETALSKIQSQGQWLAGQINASYSGWA